MDGARSLCGLLLLFALGCSSGPDPLPLEPGLDPSAERAAVIELVPARVHVDRLWLEQNAEAALSVSLLSVEPDCLRIRAVDEMELAEPVGPGRWALAPGTREIELELDPRGVALVLAEGEPAAFEGVDLALPSDARAHLEIAARYSIERPLTGRALVRLQSGGRYRLALNLGYERAAFGLWAEEAGWLYRRQLGPELLHFQLETAQDDPRNAHGQGVEGLRLAQSAALEGDG